MLEISLILIIAQRYVNKWNKFLDKLIIKP